MSITAAASGKQGAMIVDRYFSRPDVSPPFCRSAMMPAAQRRAGAATADSAPRRGRCCSGSRRSVYSIWRHFIFIARGHYHDPEYSAGRRFETLLMRLTVCADDPGARHYKQHRQLLDSPHRGSPDRRLAEEGGVNRHHRLESPIASRQDKETTLLLMATSKY